MTKERFIELIEKLNEDQFEEIKTAINSRTFEYGWTALDENHDALIKELWDED